VVALSAVVVAATASGCGGASPRSVSSSSSDSRSTTASASTTAAASGVPTVATICTAKGRAAIEGSLKAASIVTHGSVADSDYPQCLFTARLHSGGVVRVTVEVDVEPQAYAVLERTIEEASQIFPQRLFAAPQQVPHLGIDAAWFPPQQHLMTTDAVRVITVTIGWGKTPRVRKVALAVAAARAYLGRSQPKLAGDPAP
jgi:hypothetical protein